MTIMLNFVPTRGRRRRPRVGAALALALVAMTGSNRAAAWQDEAATNPPDDSTSEDPMNGHATEHTNRLVNETSPYLLQHAHNPVDWYPWGEEAFEAARREQKPIFLSIGYSTCYWCHVMERESFEDEATAAIMNESFINIKVDREERPDVDDLYMTATQLMTGAGGWPMSVFLTPPPPGDLPPDEAWTGLQPFWTGTYFPPEPAAGRPSFKQVLGGIAGAWESQRGEVVEQADRVAEAVTQQLAAQQAPAPVGQEDVSLAVSHLLRIYDSTHGGFGRAPKFPQPVFIEFLMDVRDASNIEAQREQIDQAIRHTLDRMATGGMYDQIGGGFHRYSTDGQWLVPHFEKMLYDNGQLMALYARAAKTWDDPYYREIANEIGGYVRQEMTGATGVFYSAQDAEVDHREGLNYLWLPNEIEAALESAGAAALAPIVLEVYGLNTGTNFQDPHHPDDPRRNVIHLLGRPEKMAARVNLSLAEFNERLAQANEILYEARQQREQPGLDDKTLAGWNGLMIEGFAVAGRAFERPRFIDAASRAWKAIDSTMRDEQGGLLRVSRKGSSKVPAFAEDYAYLTRGLIELHRATGDAAHLDSARELVDAARERFWDAERGGYFDTLDNQRDLFVRARSSYDGATPSANSVMLNNLISLYELTNESRYLDDAIATLTSLSSAITQNPVGPINATRGLHRLLEIAPDRVRSIGAAAAGGAAPTRTVDEAEGPVQFAVEPRVATLSPGESVEVEVTLTVDEGYHLNAHDPGDESLQGVTVRLVNAPGGLSLSAEYPEGDPFTLGDQAIRVYEDSVTIPVRLKLTADASVSPGAPSGVELLVEYQVCTDEICLAPAQAALPVAIKFE
ncbi:MAG: DUF255 domain-containing protein [Phycisphaerales bacterium]